MTTCIRYSTLWTHRSKSERELGRRPRTLKALMTPRDEGRPNNDAQIVAPRAEATTEETSDIERLRRVLDGVTVQLLALIDGTCSCFRPR